jgi:DNA-binding response OmpR family regulator
LIVSGATNIVIVRDDLSIAGVAENQGTSRTKKDENALFELVYTNYPDVIVLDCRGTNRNGVNAIERIRARTGTPILVVCEPDDPLQRKYRLAGAADCLAAPFDILSFNALLQEIVQSNKGTSRPRFEAAVSYSFNGIHYVPNENMIQSCSRAMKLTTLENRILSIFVHRAQRICSRREISEALYGPQRPVSDRAIDVIVARLRKKLGDVSGVPGESFLKTEFRSGYMFVSQITATQAFDRSPGEA